MSFDTLREFVLSYLPMLISCSALGISIFALRQKVKERRVKHAESASDAALTFIRQVCQEPRIRDSDLFSYLEATRDLKIYFGRRVNRYLGQLYSNGCKLRLLHHRIRDGRAADQSRQDALDKKELLLEWFEDQIGVVNQKFKRHL